MVALVGRAEGERWNDPHKMSACLSEKKKPGLRSIFTTLSASLAVEFKNRPSGPLFRVAALAYSLQWEQDPNLKGEPPFQSNPPYIIYV